MHVGQHSSQDAPAHQELQLTLLRRPKEQAEWLQRVAQAKSESWAWPSSLSVSSWLPGNGPQLQHGELLNFKPIGLKTRASNLETCPSGLRVNSCFTPFGYQVPGLGLRRGQPTAV